MIVTDKVYRNKYGKLRKGYYMNETLVKNLIGVPAYLRKGWDMVGIFSGRAMVRIGKSTMASNVGYFLAWSIAGGEMDMEKKVVKKSPTKEVRFGMENYAFSPSQLHDKCMDAEEFDVIVYDEGRSGLEASRYYEKSNKMLEDLFQEIGFKHLVILVVLPDFFKLNSNMATARSKFLIDCFADRSDKRGYFNFYNQLSKEVLFHKGRKIKGTQIRYMAAHPNFWGRFTDFLPFSKAAYEKAKKNAVEAKGTMRKKQFEKETI